MHISFLTDNEFIIYLNKEELSSLNYDNHDEVEQYFRKLFLVLKKNYNININGYYNIKIYKDKLYGIVLEIKEEDIDYMDFFDNQVEMNIELKEDNFLYEINDYFFLENIENINIYSYKNKLYLSLKNKLSYKEYLKLMEFGYLIFGKCAKKVLNDGVKIL